MTVDEAPTLSASELRMQKLREYLAEKGRLKPPNPKPYLRDKIPTKRLAGTTSESHLPGKGKENCEPDSSALRKACVRKPLAERRKQLCVGMNIRESKAAGNTKFRGPLQHHSVSQDTKFDCSSSSSEKVRKPIQILPNTRVIVGDVSDIRNQTRKASLNTHIKAEEKPDTRTGQSLAAPFRASHQTQGIPGVSVQNKSSKSLVLAPKKPLSSGTRPGTAAVASKGQSQAWKSHASTEIPRKCQAPSKLEKKSETTTKTSALEKNAKRFLQLSAEKTAVCKAVEPKTYTQTNRGLSQINNPTQSVSQVRTKSGHGESLPRGATFQNDQRKSKFPTSFQNKSILKATAKPSGASLPPTAPEALSSSSRSKTVTTCSRNSVRPPWRPVAKASNPTPPTPLCSRTSALAGQTVPRPAKASCQLKLQAELKTPKTMAKPEVQRARTVPAPRAQKLTAAQEERQRKLQEWREAKGISYKRPPMPVRQRRRKTVALPVPYWASMEEEDEAHSLVCAVERSLADCVKLLQEGCPSEQVRDVLSRVPMAKGFSKYWICQAKLKELDGDLDVLPLFEEAVRVVREPVDELRSVVFEILKKKEKQGVLSSKAQGEVEEDDNDESQNGDGIQQQQRDLLSTPKPVRVLIQSSQGGSSVVKYKVTATPGGFRSQSKEAVRMDGQEVRFFTPVRRSVRIEKTALHYPTALQEHDLCVSSCCDLLSKGEDLEKECVSPSQNSPLYIYRENEALQDQVHLKLVFPEETNSL